MVRPCLSDAELERRYQALIVTLRGEFPGFRLVRKRDDLGQWLIHLSLCVLTLGRMRRYLSDYQTTIGSTVYVTESWPALPPLTRWATLRHEAVHLRQFRRLGLWPMALLYLLLPLPMGLAYFRMRLEREAYEETLRAYHEALGGQALRDAGLRDHVLCQFTSAAYGFMWPFPRQLRRWYDRFVTALDELDAKPDTKIDQIPS